MNYELPTYEYRCLDCAVVRDENDKSCRMCHNQQPAVPVASKLGRYIDHLLRRLEELTRPTMDPISLDRPIDLWPVRRCGRCDRVLHIELDYCGRCRADLAAIDKLRNGAAGGDLAAQSELDALDPF